jgi:hypothetical protein
MRVLVTGSRVWKDGLFIREKLNTCLDTARAVNDKLTVVHGACRNGADAYADAWAQWHERNTTTVRVIAEAHPANWEGPCMPQCQPHHRRVDPRGWDVCPAAGFYRNEAMVGLGADLVLAFIAEQSKGATHCARYAEQKGLQVLYFHTGAVAEALF